MRSDRAMVQPSSLRAPAGARSATDVDEHVGGRLRRRRVARGLSQDALAKILGVSFQQLHKYETGENRISVSRLYQLCLVLDAPLDWFFEGLPQKSREGEYALPPEKPVLPYDLGNAGITRETMALLRAYQRIVDPKVREMILSLVVMLGQKHNTADVA